MITTLVWMSVGCFIGESMYVILGNKWYTNLTWYGVLGMYAGYIRGYHGIDVITYVHSCYGKQLN